MGFVGDDGRQEQHFAEENMESFGTMTLFSVGDCIVVATGK